MKKKVLSIVSIILVIVALTVVFAACNAESYESKLKNKDYDVALYGLDDPDVIAFNKAIAGVYKEGIEWKLVAAKSNGIDVVNIFKFNNIKDAKKFAESDYCKTFGPNVERSTTCVFVGTEQGVKDAK